MSRAFLLALAGGICGVVMPAAGADSYDGRYLDAVQRYADTMLAVGRDSYGTGSMPVTGDVKASGLFLSAMDRKAAGGPKAFTTQRPGGPAGVRANDRVGHGGSGALVGSNVGHDQGVYQTLYELSRTTGQTNYAAAADGALGWFFRNARSGPSTGYANGTDLLPWGEHLSWDVYQDKAISGYGDDAPYYHEFYGDWTLWQRTHELGPAGAKAFALGLWDHHVREKTDANGNIGDYDRHAEYRFHAPRDQYDFPRHGGFMIHTWAEALARTTAAEATADGRSLRGEYQAAIDAVLTRFERKQARDSYIQLSDNSRDANSFSLGNALPLVIAAGDAAALVDDPALRNRLADLFRTQDDLVLGLAHDPADKGFVSSVTISTGAVSGRSDKWGLSYGDITTAELALDMHRRVEQLRSTADADDADRANAYASLVVAAADGYFSHGAWATDGDSWDSDADGDWNDERIWARELASIILLELAAYELTDDAAYLDRARHFGDLAIPMFWGQYDLPRASTDVGHYETITGAGDLSRALLELHRATVPEPAAAGPLLVLLGSLVFRRRRARDRPRPLAHSAPLSAAARSPAWRLPGGNRCG